MTPRELPGFQKKSFVISFHGGEIWIEHLDGIYGNEDLVVEKLSEDYNVFRRPSMPSLICVNLDETVITHKIVRTISDFLLRTEKRITRVSFVGTGKAEARALKKACKEKTFALKFHDDFEKAKEWLVSEMV